MRPQKYPVSLNEQEIEIELSVLVHQCLKRRIPDTATLRHEVDAWQTVRNTQHAIIHWQFDAAQARTKLAPLS